jgi:hypothetical protein
MRASVLSRRASVSGPRVALALASRSRAAPSLVRPNRAGPDAARGPLSLPSPPLQRALVRLMSTGKKDESAMSVAGACRSGPAHATPSEQATPRRPPPSPVASPSVRSPAPPCRVPCRYRQGVHGDGRGSDGSQEDGPPAQGAPPTRRRVESAAVVPPRQPALTPTPPIPPAPSCVQLTGRSGEIVEQLYIAAGKDNKKFDAITKQLEVRARAARHGGDTRTCCRRGLLFVSATASSHHRALPSSLASVSAPRRALLGQSSRRAWSSTASSPRPTTGACHARAGRHSHVSINGRLWLVTIGDRAQRGSRRYDRRSAAPLYTVDKGTQRTAAS